MTPDALNAKIVFVTTCFICVLASQRNDSDSSRQTGDKRDDEKNEEQEEQDLRHARRGDRDSAEAEYCGDDRHNKEHKRPVQHSATPFRPPSRPALIAANSRPRAQTPWIECVSSPREE